MSEFRQWLNQPMSVGFPPSHTLDQYRIAMESHGYDDVGFLCSLTEVKLETMFVTVGITKAGHKERLLAMIAKARAEALLEGGGKGREHSPADRKKHSTRHHSRDRERKRSRSRSSSHDRHRDKDRKEKIIEKQPLRQMGEQRYECCIHGSMRVLDALVPTVDGRWMCKPNDRCRTNKSITEGNTAKCYLHGSQRLIQCLQKRADGQWECRETDSCRDTKGKQRQSNNATRMTPSLNSAVKEEPVEY